MTRTQTQTQARTNAEDFAERLRAVGWTVEVTVDRTELVRYDDGDVMRPARENVFFVATREWYDGSVSAQWSTVIEGRARTTRFLGGWRRGVSGKNRRIYTRGSLENWVSVLADN